MENYNHHDVWDIPIEICKSNFEFCIPSHEHYSDNQPNANVQNPFSISNSLELDNYGTISLDSDRNTTKEILKSCLHPKLWAKEELQLMKYLHEIYGDDWNTILNLIKSPKSVTFLKSEYDSYEKALNNFPMFDLVNKSCETCKESVEPSSAIVCDCCETAYHLRCTPLRKLPMKNWFCSDECKSIGVLNCEICKNIRDAEHMLICDECNKGHHMYCLKEPLKVIPEGDWYCDTCSMKFKDIPMNLQQNMRNGPETTSKCSHRYEAIESKTKGQSLSGNENVDWKQILSLSKVCVHCTALNNEDTLLKFLSNPFSNEIHLPVEIGNADFQTNFRLDISTFPTTEKDISMYFEKFIGSVDNWIDRISERVYRTDTHQNTTIGMTDDNSISNSSISSSTDTTIDGNENKLVLDKRRTRRIIKKRKVYDDIDTSKESNPKKRLSSSILHKNPNKLKYAPTVTDTTKFWIFQANPKYYNLEKSIKKLKNMTWFVKQHTQSIKKNDKAFLWESGKEAGILAVATIVSDPCLIEEDPAMSEYFRASIFGGIKLRCRLRIEYVLSTKIKKEFLINHPELKNVSILRAPIGTNFKVSEIEGELLEQEALRLSSGSIHSSEEFLKESPVKAQCSRCNTSIKNPSGSTICTSCKRHFDSKCKMDVQNLRNRTSESWICEDCEPILVCECHTHIGTDIIFCCSCQGKHATSCGRLSKLDNDWLCTYCFVNANSLVNMKIFLMLREMRAELHRLCKMKCELSFQDYESLLMKYSQKNWIDVLKALGKFSQDLNDTKNTLVCTAMDQFQKWKTNSFTNKEYTV